MDNKHIVFCILQKNDNRIMTIPSSKKTYSIERNERRRLNVYFVLFKLFHNNLNVTKT